MPLADRRPGPVWITGATSFLGGHVARHFAASGHEIIGIARRPVSAAAAACCGYSAVETGPFEPALLDRVRDRFGAPVLVFHAIGSGSVGQAEAEPAADATRTLGSLEALIEVLQRRAPAARLIYPSSAAVYGSVGADPIPETAPSKPISVYGRHKSAAEAVCDGARARGLDVVVARYFSVFGAPQRKLLFWDLGQRLLAGEREVTLGGTGEEARDFIHVSDAAVAVALLAEAENPPAVINIGTGTATSIRLATKLLVESLGIAATIRFSGVTRPDDPPCQHADVTCLKNLGFAPLKGLKDGLEEYAGWLRCLPDEAEPR